MQTISPHPARRSSVRFARKYGPTFNTFDDVANVSLCAQELGPVHIDCRFRHSKTILGVLEATGNRAGILYVDLGFCQPTNCPLTSAVIWISLEEGIKEEKNGPTGGGKRTKSTAPLKPTRNTSLSGEPEIVQIEPHSGKSHLPQFTNDLGPRQLEGKPTDMTTKNTIHLTPEVNFLGNGGGGLGYDHEETFTQTSRWMFTGNVLPGSKFGAMPRNGDGPRGMIYRTLKWELSGDDFQRQSRHSSVIQTAFTLEHDIDPFLIRVEIQGKLRRNSERLKSNMQRLLRFPSGPQKKDAKSTILVIPDKEQIPTRRLDPIAKGLPLQMERLNLEGLRVQLPDSIPVSFQDVSQAARSSNARTETAVEEDHSDPIVPLHSQQSSPPIYKPPKQFTSPVIRQPTMQPIASRLGSIEATPVGSCGPLLVCPQFERAEQSRDNPQPSRQQAHTRCRTEGGHIMLSTLHNPQPEPIQISPRVDSIIQDTSKKELDELAVQIAQIPVLLFLIEWLIYLAACLPVKMSKKNVK
jgi:hypothetical protein